MWGPLSPQWQHVATSVHTVEYVGTVHTQHGFAVPTLATHGPHTATLWGPYTQRLHDIHPPVQQFP